MTRGAFPRASACLAIAGALVAGVAAAAGEGPPCSTDASGQVVMPRVEVLVRGGRAIGLTVHDGGSTHTISRASLEAELVQAEAVARRAGQPPPQRAQALNRDGSVAFEYAPETLLPRLCGVQADDGGETRKLTRAVEKVVLAGARAAFERWCRSSPKSSVCTEPGKGAAAGGAVATPPRARQIPTALGPGELRLVSSVVAGGAAEVILKEQASGVQLRLYNDGTTGVRARVELTLRCGSQKNPTVPTTVDLRADEGGKSDWHGFSCSGYSTRLGQEAHATLVEEPSRDLTARPGCGVGEDGGVQLPKLSLVATKAGKVTAIRFESPAQSGVLTVETLARESGYAAFLRGPEGGQARMVRLEGRDGGVVLELDADAVLAHLCATRPGDPSLIGLLFARFREVADQRGADGGTDAGASSELHVVMGTRN